MTETRVRGHVLPGRLTHLIETRRWTHPGDAVMARVIPWFADPLDFLTDPPAMERESRSLDQLVDNEDMALLFQLTRSRRPDRDGLPWLDVGNAVLLAICRYAGDDTALALDYRDDPAEPRVVGSDIWTVPGQCHWRTVAETFAAFAEMLERNDHDL